MCQAVAMFLRNPSRFVEPPYIILVWHPPLFSLWRAINLDRVVDFMTFNLIETGHKLAVGIQGV